MLRIVFYLLTIALAATGLGWLADRPGSLHIVWQDYDIETSVFHAVVILAATIAAVVFLWSLFRTVLNSPSVIGQRIVRRRQKKGLDAVSSGLIAVGAGDSALAAKYAQQARKSLPHEPLTHLLRAQSADLAGDRVTARRIYEAMLASPETEQFGLHGLFLEAERENANEAAQHYAGRALRSNTKLAWPSNALFRHQCKQNDWAGALETLEHAKKHGHIAKVVADRKRAVLLTASAQELEDDAADRALPLALEAHTLAPDLIPAAAIAGRILASKGSTGKAAKILQKTWAKAPHPDLAAAYAYARVGDSTRDRLDRVRQLAALNPHSIESPIAVATVAVDARMFEEARSILEPLIPDRLTHRIAMLMARVEGGDNGDKGRVREWLARASHAPRDPVWLADGVVSDIWEATSPTDGRLDAFEWRVPVEARDASRTEVLARRLEELLALEAPLAQSLSANADAHSDAVTVETSPSTTVAIVGKASNGSTEAVSEGDNAITATPPTGTRKKDAEKAATVATAVRGNESRRTKRSKSNEDDGPLARVPDDPGVEDPAPQIEQPIARRSFRSVN